MRQDLRLYSADQALTLAEVFHVSDSSSCCNCTPSHMIAQASVRHIDTDCRYGSSLMKSGNH
jgi:hypothetical protein